MDRRNWRRALRRHWRVAVAVFAFVFALGVFAAYLPTERFEARATVLALPVPSTSQPSAVQAVRFMLPSLARKAESRSFTELVLDSASFPYARASVTISAKGDPNTGIVTITASGAEREAVAPAANLIADALVKSRTGEGFMTMTLIDSAVTPSTPASPNRPVDLLTAALLAVGLAVLATTLMDSWAQQMDRTEMIRTRFGTAVLGEIPAVRRSVARRALRRPADLFGEDSASAVAEALYALRTNLAVLLHGRHIDAVTVTSLAAGEGKSTVAAGLGWVLASGGEEVVLIDGNLRSPALHRMFDQPVAEGLAEAAGPSAESTGSATEPISPLVQPTQLPNLRLVQAGLSGRHPAELLRVSLPKVLDVLSGPDRLAIIDSPAMQGMSDASTAAAITGFALLVVDVRVSASVDIEHALDELRSKNTEVLGVVINRVRTSRARARENRYYKASRRESFPGG